MTTSDCNVPLLTGGEARQVRLWSHSDVMGAAAAEASSWEDSKHCGHRHGEILQVCVCVFGGGFC